MPRKQPLGYKRKGTRQGGPYKCKTTTADTLNAVSTGEAFASILPVAMSTATSQQEIIAAEHSKGSNLDERIKGKGTYSPQATVVRAGCNYLATESIESTCHGMLQRGRRRRRAI